MRFLQTHPNQPLCVRPPRKRASTRASARTGTGTALAAALARLPVSHLQPTLPNKAKSPIRAASLILNPLLQVNQSLSLPVRFLHAPLYSHIIHTSPRDDRLAKESKTGLLQFAYHMKFLFYNLSPLDDGGLGRGKGFPAMGR